MYLKWRLLTLVTELPSPAWKTKFGSSFCVTGVMSLGCVSWSAVYGTPRTVPIVQTAPAPIHPITLIMSPRVIPRFAVNATVWSVPVLMASLTSILNVAVIMFLYTALLWRTVSRTVWSVKVSVANPTPVARITLIMAPRVICSHAVY